MRNYLNEYEELQNDMNDEMNIIYKILKTKLGSQPLIMGRDPLTNDKKIISHIEIVKIRRHTIKVGNFYTKIDNIGIDTMGGTPNVIVKGFQFGKNKYTIKVFRNLAVHEKQELFDYLKKEYKDIL